jgi:kynureninase
MLPFNENLDLEDGFPGLKQEFSFTNPEIAYLNGNSLGPKPRKADEYVLKQMERWSTYLVKAHTETSEPWVSFEEPLRAQVASFLGTSPEQLMLMNALSVNLHLALFSFYQPTPTRYKVIYLNAFSSDVYAIKTQIQQRLNTLSCFLDTPPFNHEDALVRIDEDDNFFVSYEKIQSLLDLHGSQTALLMIEGVHYRTGQAFNIQKIAHMAASYGIKIGVDLAHVVGNIPINLDTMGIDFAVWCHYKYMNAGPGAIGGFYVHHKHLNNPEIFKLQGWWGVDLNKRFLMSSTFEASPTAASWSLSNPPLLSLAILAASLDIFEKIDMQQCFQKSLRLGQYLIQLLQDELKEHVQVVTGDERGCQISLKINSAIDLNNIEKELYARGVYCDVRSQLLRVAPNGLYNSYKDIYRFVFELKNILLNQ